MNLPDLPKVYKRKEAKIDSLVLDWFVQNWHNSVAIEVKIKGNKILLHQQLALNQVAKGQFSYKIPDMGNRICFDGFVLKDADSFLVTCDGHACEGLNIKTNEKIYFKIKSRK